jgi:hypothetical protein
MYYRKLLHKAVDCYRLAGILRDISIGMYRSPLAQSEM